MKPLGGTHLRALTLLVVGYTRPAIAGALHLSHRAVDLHLADIKRVLGTTRRVCVGVRAVRDGWVARQHPISHARQRLGGGPWTDPSMRRLEIVRSLADDATVEQVAERWG